MSARLRGTLVLLTPTSRARWSSGKSARLTSSAAPGTGCGGPERYPFAVLSVQRLRERLPLIVFVLLLVLLVMLVGIGCACATDHPMQALERALAGISAMPAVIELSTYTWGAMLLASALVFQRRQATGRASPQQLQRFLL